MRLKTGACLALAAGLLVAACGRPDPAERALAPDAMMFEVSELPRPEVRRLPVDGPANLLFVGNSYLYYGDSVHNHVRRMVIEAGLFDGESLAYKSATIGGAALPDHNIEHLLQHQNLRVEAPFEAVILQGLSSAALSEEGRRRFSETAARFASLIEAEGAAPVLYMTHAYVEPHRRASPEMIGQVASLYIETGNDIGALVIPVGLAFEEAYRRRPGQSLHTLFDGSHPNQDGTYLAAATVFATLYRTSPVGNGYDYFGEVDSETARFLQQVAHDTVEAFFEVELEREMSASTE